MWPYRSLLFIPGIRPEWAKKATKYQPDAVILDLEDAVPPDRKAEAREYVRSVIPAVRSAAPNLGIFVRVNGTETGLLEEDLGQVVVPGLTGILLPKVSSRDDVLRLDGLLTYLERREGLQLGSTEIIVLPETAEGIRNLYDIVRGTPRVAATFGVISGTFGGDVAAAVGFRPTRDGLEQVYMNSKVVLDSRAAGVRYPVVGLIGTPIEALDQVRSVARRARALGYRGAAVIHPSHVAIANEVFQPTDEEIDWATRLIEAVNTGHEQGVGAIRFEGYMVDPAMTQHAREILAEAERFGLTGGGKKGA